MADARVYQELVEVAVTDQTTDVRVSQQIVEVAVTDQTTDVRVVQLLVEVAVLIAGIEPLDGTGNIFSAEAFGHPTVIGNRTVLPSGITSHQAFGTPTIPQDRTVSPSAIASAEVVGPINVQGTIYPSGITTAEAFGTPNIAQARTVAPTAIASAEDVGDATIVGALTPAGIASAEAFGTPNIAQDRTVEPATIASAEAVGPIHVQGIIYPVGIASARAVGTPRVQNNMIQPVGIPSVDQPGFPSVSGPTVKKSKTIRLNNRGIHSAEAVGTPRLAPGTVQPAPIASAEVVGAPNVVTARTIAPTAIASAQAVGAPSIARPDTVIPDAIPSAEALGIPLIVRAQTVEPTGIPSAEAVGTPTLVTLAQTVEPTGIPSAEAVGTPTVVQAPAIIVTPAAIPSATAFGTPIVTLGPNGPLTPSSIASRLAFGLPRIILGIPLGPDGRPGRIANRLYDPATGVSFAWTINHSEEEAQPFARRYEAGAPTTVSLVRHQRADDPPKLVFRGTILQPAQKAALDYLYAFCDAATLIYDDYSGDSYEVVITTWDCREERARNPQTHALLIWRYTLEMEVLRYVAGPVPDVIGAPVATVADVRTLVPDQDVSSAPTQPTGIAIASSESFGSPAIVGGNAILLPAAIRSEQAFGATTFGGGATNVPAAFGSRLRAQGTSIVDGNGAPLGRMTGGSVHCLPGFIPPQAFLHDVAGKGGRFVRVVCLWDRHEPTQGTWDATMRTQLDTLIARATAAELYVLLELHLNTGNIPGWATSGAGETAKYATYGEFITRAFAQRYADNPVVLGFGLNETPLDDDTIRGGTGAIPYLESVQRQMIAWMRADAPDWIGFVTLGYANQTPYPDAPRTPASTTAYDAVGGNVVLDVHDYYAGANSSDPSFDGRQPNGMIHPTYQGGLAYWQIQEHPISYTSTATRRGQMAAYLADYKTFSQAAQIPLLIGEIGWMLNNTAGKAEWWADKLAVVDDVAPAMLGQWILGTSPQSQDPWISAPSGTWEPGVVALLGSGG